MLRTLTATESCRDRERVLVRSGVRGDPRFGLPSPAHSAATLADRALPSRGARLPPGIRSRQSDNRLRPGLDSICWGPVGALSVCSRVPERGDHGIAAARQVVVLSVRVRLPMVTPRLAGRRCAREFPACWSTGRTPPLQGGGEGSIPSRAPHAPHRSVPKRRRGLTVNQVSFDGLRGFESLPTDLGRPGRPLASVCRAPYRRGGTGRRTTLRPWRASRPTGGSTPLAGTGLVVARAARVPIGAPDGSRVVPRDGRAPRVRPSTSRTRTRSLSLHRSVARGRTSSRERRRQPLARRAAWPAHYDGGCPRPEPEL